MKKILTITAVCLAFGLLFATVPPLVANAQEDPNDDPIRILAPLLNQPVLSASSQSSRTIQIFGPINSNTSYSVTTRIRELDAVSHDPITIYITSPGGSVYDGLAILGEMDHASSPIQTICVGYCMSMGATILSHGAKGMRIARPHSTVLIHQLSGQTSGTATQMINDVKEASRLQSVLLDILEKDTGKPRNVLKEAVSFDNAMSAEDAKAFGLLDVVK